jgi:hypothetical protein
MMTCKDFASFSTESHSSYNYNIYETYDYLRNQSLSIFYTRFSNAEFLKSISISYCRFMSNTGDCRLHWLLHFVSFSPFFIFKIIQISISYMFRHRGAIHTEFFTSKKYKPRTLISVCITIIGTISFYVTKLCDNIT